MDNCLIRFKTNRVLPKSLRRKASRVRIRGVHCLFLNADSPQGYGLSIEYLKEILDKQNLIEREERLPPLTP